MEARSKQYNNKINDLSNTFFSVLDDLKKYYVYFHLHPESNEYQNFYETSQSQLQQIMIQMFTIGKNIQSEVEYINEEMIQLKDRIKKERINSDKLTNISNNIEMSNNGSNVLINDTKKLYNVQYLNNIELFIGILICGGLLFKIFPSKSV
jgi:hypothetical protein